MMETLIQLNTDCQKWSVETLNKIDNICNKDLNYKDSSVLSHIRDRLSLFIEELNEFTTQKREP